VDGVPAFPMTRQCPFDPPAELGELPPVSRVQLWNGSTPWLVTRYDDVRAVLRDSRISADSDRPGYPHQSAASAARRKRAKSFITMDGPSTRPSGACSPATSSSRRWRRCARRSSASWTTSSTDCWPARNRSTW
jgi:cytochrome P450